jgi:Zn-dependent alcohol dehydrogenase
MTNVYINQTEKEGKRMKAAVMREYGKPLTIEDIEMSGPQAGEVKVKISSVGLCHTDISAFHGGFPPPLPVVLGHEGAGVVEEVGIGVTGLKQGDKVLFNALVYCGECSNCAKGYYGACMMNGFLMFGGTMRDHTTRLKKGDETIHSYFCQSSFAEYSITHQDFLIKVPQDLDIDKLTPLCCGAATGIGAVFNRAKVWPAAEVAVLGCGVVGMGAIMAAKLSGAMKIIAIDLLEQKLNMAQEFGATHTVNGSKEDVVESVRALSDGGVDFAIEAIGKGETISQSLDALKPGGISVVVGAVPFGEKATIDPVQLVGEKAIMGSIIGTLKPHYDIPKYIELYRTGQLPIDKLIQAEYPLEKINEAIEAAQKGEFLKAIIKM